jgi:uncharacterized protein YdiU (UPF0061 family)
MSAHRPSTAHAALGPDFFDPVEPARFPAHVLRHRNQAWAARVGLDGLSEAQWIAHFGRFEPLPGSLEQPLALRYHGHQFRSYNPDLGDGRGFLFAQLHDLADGRLLDLATKGSGPTPWSRGADGRLTLKGGVREVLATAMLEAQGVNTSKSFSLIETGEALQRHDEPSPTRAAVLVRLSHSHIRIGSFQRLAHLRDPAGVQALVDHAIRHYFPDLAHDEPIERVRGFYARVVANVARMGAQWMAAGFVHGVLNTDNINITGESFDYGPWRWLPTYDPAFTAAYFDYHGLYAYGKQPETLLWNLAQLGSALLTVVDKAVLIPALDTFEPAMHTEYAAATLRRLGLAPRGIELDAALARAFAQALEASRVPFEQAWFDWHGGLGGARQPAYRHASFDEVRAALRGYEPARPGHAYFRGDRPCTMLIDEVEALWAPIAAHDDWSALTEKLAAIGEMAEAYGLSSPPSPVPSAAG